MTTAQPLPTFESARLFALEQFKVLLEADPEGLRVLDDHLTIHSSA